MRRENNEVVSKVVTKMVVKISQLLLYSVNKPCSLFNEYAKLCVVNSLNDSLKKNSLNDVKIYNWKHA